MQYFSVVHLPYSNYIDMNYLDVIFFKLNNKSISVRITYIYIVHNNVIQKKSSLAHSTIDKKSKLWLLLDSYFWFLIVGFAVGFGFFERTGFLNFASIQRTIFFRNRIPVDHIFDASRQIMCRIQFGLRSQRWQMYNRKCYSILNWEYKYVHW